MLYRQVNVAARADYDRLIASGLYDTLVSSKLLIPHEEVVLPGERAPEAYRYLKPRLVPTTSYPYSWCFSQLKDAALLTLAVQRQALAAGMSLKDASAYNVQFLDGRPVLVDTLSLEVSGPTYWKPYRQFCQHFYAPLALMAFLDTRFARLSAVFIDGVPLRLASRALPLRTWLRPGPLLHIHLHAWGEQRFAQQGTRAESRRSPSATGIPALIHSLERATAKLRWTGRSAWLDYYGDRASYTGEAIDQKTRIVQEWLETARPSVVWDLGANTGHFSRVATALGIRTVALEQDPACVEQMYVDAKRRGDRHLLPLVMDLTNPSAAIGWAHEERLSLIERGPADMVLALALLHHLAIGNNVPLDRIAAFLAKVGRQAIVEFVPKDDPMAVALLTGRRDVFAAYGREEFVAALQRHFAIERTVDLPGSTRALYWVIRRD